MLCCLMYAFLDILYNYMFYKYRHSVMVRFDMLSPDILIFLLEIMDLTCLP